MKTFRAHELAIEFHQIAKTMQLPGYIKDQFLRATSSIALNLAEGNAKHSYKDKSRIYQIALGSLREAQTVLRLEDVTDQRIIETADKLGASIFKLIEAIQSSCKKSDVPF